MIVALIEEWRRLSLNLQRLVVSSRHSLDQGEISKRSQSRLTLLFAELLQHFVQSDTRLIETSCAPVANSKIDMGVGDFFCQTQSLKSSRALRDQILCNFLRAVDLLRASYPTGESSSPKKQLGLRHFIQAFEVCT